MRLLTALLSTTLALKSGGRAQVLPAGEFAARDGRPGPGKTWRLTDAQGRALAARLNAVAAQTPIVVDYDHQTLHAATNGQPAPAAGWMQLFEWLSGKGLFADIDWTPRAKGLIDGGEYKFFSPVISWDEATGEVTGLALGALVNFPGLLGMEPVLATLAAQFSLSTNPPSETDMALLALLISSLGLPADTTEAAALSAVSALRATVEAAGTRPAVPKAITAALGLADTADEATALSAVTALQASNATVHQSIAALSTQVATLTAQHNDRHVTEAVDRAIAEGRMVPASRQVFLDIGRKDYAQLSGLLSAMPVIPGLAGQTGGTDPTKGAGGQQGGQQTTALSGADALAVAAAMGISAEAWNKALPKA